MGNVTTTDLTAIDNSSTVTSINNNIQTLRDEFDKVVYKDGREELTGNLDANTKRIINLPVATTSTEPLTLGQVETAFSEVATGSLLAEAILRAAGDAARPTTTALLLATAAATIGSTDGTVQTDIDSAKARLTAIETITPTGEDLPIALADALRPFPAGPREAIIYNDADSVKVYSNFVQMGGFRFRGQYTKGRSPVFAMPASKVAEYNTTGCPVFSSVKTETWVGIFACADSGDATATLRTMPFLRLAAPVGSVANIIKGGENVHDLATTASHSWTATNNLAGTDCLVISEGTSAFSGRVTTITANTNTSVTLASIGTIGAGDFILPAPPGFDHYVYLGSFYFDTAEVRNIYDSGTLVKAKMIFHTQVSHRTGSVAGGQLLDFRGYISPLATALVLDASCVLSTASTGDYAEYFDADGGSHVVQSEYIIKAIGSSQAVVFANVQIPFLYHQSFVYSNAGTLAGSRINGQLNITGWIEP